MFASAKKNNKYMSTDPTKTFHVLHLNLSQNANVFVKCWSSLYNYPDYELYKSTVTKPEISKKDLRKLFTWKNGMALSSKKENSFLSQVLQHEELVNELKKEFNQKKFEKTFGKMSAVWQIFLLHIIQPYEYPIFDRYVYRAYRFIQNLDEQRLPSSQSERLKLFHEEYSPFFNDMVRLADEFDQFDIDKALWTFGKVIKEYPGLLRAGT
jgi:hypothetical protein